MDPEARGRTQSSSSTTARWSSMAGVRYPASAPRKSAPERREVGSNSPSWGASKKRGLDVSAATAAAGRSNESARMIFIASSSLRDAVDGRQRCRAGGRVGETAGSVEVAAEELLPEQVARRERGARLRQIGAEVRGRRAGRVAQRAGAEDDRAPRVGAEDDELVGDHFGPAAMPAEVRGVGRIGEDWCGLRRSAHDGVRALDTAGAVEQDRAVVPLAADEDEPSFARRDAGRRHGVGGERERTLAARLIDGARGAEGPQV